MMMLKGPKMHEALKDSFFEVNESTTSDMEDPLSKQGSQVVW